MTTRATEAGITNYNHDAELDLEHDLEEVHTQSTNDGRHQEHLDCLHECDNHDRDRQAQDDIPAMQPRGDGRRDDYDKDCAGTKATRSAELGRFFNESAEMERRRPTKRPRRCERSVSSALSVSPAFRGARVGRV